MDVYRVMIECPNTGASVPTGVEVSELEAFDFIGLMPKETACPHCPERHRWTKRHAWLERHGASRVRLRAAPVASRP